MIASLMALSVRMRWAVLALFLAIAGIGMWQLTKLPIDAVPDITNNQVQINTSDPALSPVEMEKLVTYPVETALAGIPGLETTRSLSRNGFSQVTAIFSDSTDLYFARQQVGERLSQARDNLPEGVQPQIGPVTTGLGEVVMYTVGYANPDGKGAKRTAGQPGWQPDGSYLTPEGEQLTDEVAKAGYLRTVQDWIISPQLKSVKGDDSAANRIAAPLRAAAPIEVRPLEAREDAVEGLLDVHYPETVDEEARAVAEWLRARIEAAPEPPTVPQTCVA